MSRRPMEYKHIPKELVLNAVIDMAEGNRLLTSKAYLRRRIAEIRYDRATVNTQFDAFEKTLWKAKE